MNKQEAAKQLEALQAEVEKLKAIIEKPDEPHVFQGRYLRKGSEIGYWWVSSLGTVLGATAYPSGASGEIGNLFASHHAAEQHLKHLRLMQEARVAMAKSWGDVKPDWTDADQNKYVIKMLAGKTTTDIYTQSYYPIHFRAAEDREQFFNRYSEDELKLMIMGVQ